jgi:hypothetical protein
MGKLISVGYSHSPIVNRSMYLCLLKSAYQQIHFASISPLLAATMSGPMIVKRESRGGKIRVSILLRLWFSVLITQHHHIILL